MTNFSEFAHWLFYALMSGISVYGVKILSDMKSSIETLNIQVATVIERNNWQQKQVDDLEDRVKILESRP